MLQHEFRLYMKGSTVSFRRLKILIMSYTRKIYYCSLLVFLLLKLPAFGQLQNVQDSSIDYTSKVPKFVFASSLREQQEQLKTNPLILRFAESRKKLAADKFRPVY